MAEERPKPPVSGIIYGEIAYWIVIAGMVVAIAGTAIYMSGTGYVDKQCILEKLWAGNNSTVIWEKCAGVETPHGHWYINKFNMGDGIAMAGIALGCLAAVIGMWGAFIGMVREKGGIYVIFALVVAIILSLSAAGLIALKH
ncbi:MAG TPA: DUF1634 domain-containing protein [Archaeoglobaceae archaeon]|nr:DUF1634 domain-containing protein [Archaeoglobaceae archaeon]